MDINSAVISTSTAARPTRVLIHGIEGWGKTWLASHFPDPVWLAPENGFPRDLAMTPSRINITAWRQLYGAVKMLIEQPHSFKTLVIDSVDWVEPLIHAFVLERDSGRETEMNKKGKKLESIEDYGYGKGYIAAEEQWRDFIEKLDELQARRGMHVVLIAHSQVKTFRNPRGEDFDRWQPKMHDRISRVCVEWPETVLFGHYDLAAGKLDSDDKKAKGFSEGKRLVGLCYSAMYDAKNRLGLAPLLELTSAADFVPYLLGKHLSGYVEPKTMTQPPTTMPIVATPPALRVESQSAVRDENGSQRAPTAPAESAKRREAQTWTEPKSPPSQTQQAASPAVPRAPAQPQSSSSTATAPAVDPALLEGVTRALTLAKQKGEPYLNNVNSWLKQAQSDPRKLKSIVDKVNADCAALAPS